MMTEALHTLKKWVEESDNLVFFGGAGVSTESGIPDFRSVDGLYHQQYDYPPETILSHTFYRQKPEEFYRFYRAKMLCLDAKPNAAHRKLAQWEQEGKLKAVVTQNIDGFIRRREAKWCWNCTDPYYGTTASAAGLPMTRSISCIRRECQRVPAAAVSSRMWCCMRKGWTRRRFRMRCIISVRQMY